MSASVLLGILLAFVLIVQLLIPIRKLTYKTAPSEEPKRPGDEVKTLNRQVHGLVKDMDNYPQGTGTEPGKVSSL